MLSKTMAEVNNLQDWVTSEMVRGRYIFTKEDVLGLHLPISDQALQNSLYLVSQQTHWSAHLISPLPFYHFG